MIFRTLYKLLAYQIMNAKNDRGLNKIIPSLIKATYPKYDKLDANYRVSVSKGCGTKSPYRSYAYHGVDFESLMLSNLLNVLLICLIHI